ncbi:MAG TPA: MarR family transcriptional regulator [Pirellulales bacterium]|jgi:predicted ArsR family transcriptional regulator|nr:MarR family transcriptional regulator [Pirellulales bacterium]
MTAVMNQPQRPDWSFLSNHTHVLHCISCWPDIRIRDIAVKVGITERAVQRILVELERTGYLKRQRVGRQNHYRLETGVHLRHPLERHVEIGWLLAVLQSANAAGEMSAQEPA